MKKRITAFVIMAVICLTASAQFRWGPVASVNLSNYYFKQDLLKTGNVVGGGVGVMGELMFTSVGIGIDMSLQWNMHGSKLHFDEYPVFAPTKTTTSYLHTLQLPISIRYKYTRLNGFEEKLAPFVYGGPMFSVTVGHNKVEPLEYPGGCFGLQCGIGAEIYRHWQVSAGYVWGMTYELRTRKLDNYSARCQYWQLKVAYLF